MLKIVVPDKEIFDESTGEFRIVKGSVLQLEHSLLSISKWESEWHIPFLNNNEKTDIQILDYIRCMTLTQNVNPEVYAILTANNMNDINEYVTNSMTATVIFDPPYNKRSSRFITNELIYCWMFQLGIPLECEKWHITRLLTLIRVMKEEIKAANSNDKMTKAEAISRQKAINQANRAKYHSRG